MYFLSNIKYHFKSTKRKRFQIDLVALNELIKMNKPLKMIKKNMFTSLITF